MAAQIKVFLPTYRRNFTLKRSIDSLLKQTFVDWRCEVHNDDPNDPFPTQYVSELNDTRFSVIDHKTNLGPVNTFNLAFDKCDETYVTLLEDDNWWEPQFLETMFILLEKRKDVNTAWANMHLWQEEPGNHWVDTQKTIWPQSIDEITSFSFPQPVQVASALHSNGAMLIRNVNLKSLKTPENIRFDLVEPIRERAFTHPLLLVNKPLANFAHTINSSRKADITSYYENSILLVDSFFTCIQPNDAYIQILWTDAREKKLRSYLNLLYIGLTGSASRKLLKHATLKEWAVFLLYNIKYPSIYNRCKNAKKTHADVWEYLLKNTSQRIAELH